MVRLGWPALDRVDPSQDGSDPSDQDLAVVEEYKRSRRRPTGERRRKAVAAQHDVELGCSDLTSGFQQIEECGATVCI
jgi:hypothetical protein